MGFEPTVRLPVQRFSRPSHSTTLAPLRARDFKQSASLGASTNRKLPPLATEKEVVAPGAPRLAPMSDPAGDVLLAKTDLEVLEHCCALSSSAAPTCSPSTSGRSDAIERNLLPLCGRTPASLTHRLTSLRECLACASKRFTAPAPSAPGGLWVSKHEGPWLEP